jgi:hypothetical protein
LETQLETQPLWLQAPNNNLKPNLHNKSPMPARMFRELDTEYRVSLNIMLGRWWAIRSLRLVGTWERWWGPWCFGTYGLETPTLYDLFFLTFISWWFHLVLSSFPCTYQLSCNKHLHGHILIDSFFFAEIEACVYYEDICSCICIKDVNAWGYHDSLFVWVWVSEWVCMCVFCFCFGRMIIVIRKEGVNDRECFCTVLCCVGGIVCGNETGA